MAALAGPATLFQSPMPLLSPPSLRPPIAIDEPSLHAALVGIFTGRVRLLTGPRALSLSLARIAVATRAGAIADALLLDPAVSAITVGALARAGSHSGLPLLELDTVAMRLGVEGIFEALHDVNLQVEDAPDWARDAADHAANASRVVALAAAAMTPFCRIPGGEVVLWAHLQDIGWRVWLTAHAVTWPDRVPSLEEGGPGHEALGERLLEAWGFPAPIREFVRTHHEDAPPGTVRTRRIQRAVAQGAACLAAEAGIVPWTGWDYPPSEGVLAQGPVPPQAIEAARAVIREQGRLC